MQRILVVCGAGASSTFLVHWMRKIAAASDPATTVRAASLSEAVDRMSEVDVLLVGSHLAAELPALRACASEAGVSAVLLPELPFDADGAARALEIAASTSVGSSRPTFHPARERETSNG